MANPEDFDPELIQRCRKNDIRACKQLYDLHSSWLYSVCLRYTANRDEAQDVLQESFILIFNNLSGYSGQGSFKGWMRRITVNCALGQYRKKGAMISAGEVDRTIENTAVDLAFLQELDTDELRYFIDLLSPGRKHVFNAYIIEGYSHKEIADQLGISEGTSKSQLFDAKRELKKAIELHYSVAKLKKTL